MAFLEFILEAIKSIPETVWAAALGSVFTVLGVLLSNRHHRAEQNAQRAHESVERERERKFSTRAEVYLLVAAEMARAQQHLGNLPNLDFTKSNAEELLSSFIASSNQAILIASDEAALAISDFLAAYTTAFFRLLPKALPIQNVKSDRDIHDSIYETYHSEVQRIIATMTHVNETDLHAETNWKALDRNLVFNQEQMQVSAEKRNEAWAMINKLNLKYMDEVAEEVKTITRATVPALIQIRKDLEISSNIESYSLQFEDRLKLMDELIEQFKMDLEAIAN